MVKLAGQWKSDEVLVYWKGQAVRATERKVGHKLTYPWYPDVRISGYPDMPEILEMPLHIMLTIVPQVLIYLEVTLSDIPGIRTSSRDIPGIRIPRGIRYPDIRISIRLYIFPGIFEIRKYQRYVVVSLPLLTVMYDSIWDCNVTGLSVPDMPEVVYQFRNSMNWYPMVSGNVRKLT